jgi:hypothetical protein
MKPSDVIGWLVVIQLGTIIVEVFLALLLMRLGK